MADLAVVTISRNGLEATYNTAAGGGDAFINTGNEFVHIKNDDASSKDITFATPAEVDGLAVADRVVSIPAGEDRMIGPFPASTYNDTAGKVQITYSAVTSVTIAVIKPGS